MIADKKLVGRQREGDKGSAGLGGWRAKVHVGGGIAGGGVDASAARVTAPGGRVAGGKLVAADSGVAGGTDTLVDGRKAERVNGNVRRGDAGGGANVDRVVAGNGKRAGAAGQKGRGGSTAGAVVDID